MRKVYVYSISTGGLLDEYDSIKQASNELKIKKSTLWDNLVGVKNNVFKRGDLVISLSNKAPTYSKQAKVLILDIETAPMVVYTWGMWDQNVGQNQVVSDWFIISWAAKWLFDPITEGHVLTPDEALRHDDKRLMVELWDMMNDADVIIGHNCVEVSTPILKQDLTWVRAGDIKVGDKLVGFEEKKSPFTPSRKNGKWIGINGKERKVRGTTVTFSHIEKRKCLKVVFDNGDEVITTKDHFWLGMAEKDRNQRWYRTDKLRVGQRINKFLNVWEPDKSYEAGWLSGFISGEGSLKGKTSGGVSSVDFCQRPTSTLDQALNYLKKLNIGVGDVYNKGGGLGKGDALYCYSIGGKWKALEIIGRLQIKRFIEKINWNKFGGLSGQKAEHSPVRVSTIVDIIDVGVREVAVISTDEKTYIANGYPMHNCKSFDLPKINTRFLIHDIMPPKPYQLIDTKLAVKGGTFAFSSNAMNYINGQLGLGTKVETNFELWKNCMAGDQDALNKMSFYNINDVTILEEMYMIIRPWIRNHPNIGLYMDNLQGRTCPTCGHTDLVSLGKYAALVNNYESFRCTNCYSTCRSRHQVVGDEDKNKLMVQTNFR